MTRRSGSDNKKPAIPTAKKAKPGKPEWPADRVERWSLERLVPYARNARTHSETQIDQIAASMREWGWTNPMLVDEAGTILAGHGRLAAARKLGWTEGPVLVARGWSEAQKRAYIIADNKLAENAGWDKDLLKVELQDIAALGGDLSLIGFSDEELSAFMAERTEGLTDPDEAPELPADPVSKLGDIWELGRHRLICGSSTDADIVGLLLAGVKPHLMVTDPPYGVEYDPAWRVRSGLGGAGTATGKVDNDDRADWREAWSLFPGAVAYVWHAGTRAHLVAQSLQACKFQIRAQIVWVKPRFVISRGAYHHQHEPVFYGVRDGEPDSWRFQPEHEVAAYAVKEGKTAEWKGDRKQSTVWYIEHLKSDTGHGTQKPVECMRRPIENNSSPGQAVYDPFVGSGTTVIAAEQTGRSCYAIELNPAYVDVAVERWQNFTGKKAVLEGTGRTFEDLKSGKTRTAAKADAPPAARGKSKPKADQSKRAEADRRPGRASSRSKR